MEMTDDLQKALRLATRGKKDQEALAKCLEIVEQSMAEYEDRVGGLNDQIKGLKLAGAEMDRKLAEGVQEKLHLEQQLVRANEWYEKVIKDIRETAENTLQEKKKLEEKYAQDLQDQRGVVLAEAQRKHDGDIALLNESFEAQVQARVNVARDAMAEETKRISAELRGAHDKLESYTNGLNTAREQLRDKREEAKAKELTIQALNRDKDRLTRQLEGSSAEVQQLLAQIAKDAETMQAQKDLSAADADRIGRLSEQVRALGIQQMRNLSAQGERERLLNERESIRAELAKANAHANRTLAEAEELKRAASALEAERDKAQADVVAATGALRLQQDEINRLNQTIESTREQAKADVQGKMNEMSALNAQMEQLNGQIQGFIADRNANANIVLGLNTISASGGDPIGRFRSFYEQAKDARALGELEGLMAWVSGNMDVLEQEHARAASKFAAEKASLEGTINARSAEATRLKRDLGAHRRAFLEVLQSQNNVDLASYTFLKMDNELQGFKADMQGYKDARGYLDGLRQQFGIADFAELTARLSNSILLERELAGALQRIGEMETREAALTAEANLVLNNMNDGWQADRNTAENTYQELIRQGGLQATYIRSLENDKNMLEAKIRGDGELQAELRRQLSDAERRLEDEGRQSDILKQQLEAAGAREDEKNDVIQNLEEEVLETQRARNEDYSEFASRMAAAKWSMMAKANAKYRKDTEKLKAELAELSKKIAEVNSAIAPNHPTSDLLTALDAWRSAVSARNLEYERLEELKRSLEERVGEKEAELAELRASANARAKEIEAREETIRQKEEEAKKLEADVGALREELGLERRGGAARLEALRVQIREKDGALQEEAEKVQAGLAEIGLLNEKLKTLQDSSASDSKSLRGRLQGEIDKKTEEVRGLEQRIRKAENDKKVLEEGLAKEKESAALALEAERVSRGRELKMLESRLLEQEEKVRGLEQNYGSREQQIAELQQSLKERADAAAGHERELEALRVSYSAAQDELQRLREQGGDLGAARARLQAKEDEVQALQLAKATAETEVQDALRAIQALRDEAKGLMASGGAALAGEREAVARLRAALREAEARAESEGAAVLEVERQRADLERLLSDEREAVARLRAQGQAQGDALREAEARARGLDGDREQAQARLREVEKEKARIEAEMRGQTEAQMKALNSTELAEMLSEWEVADVGTPQAVLSFISHLEQKIEESTAGLARLETGPDAPLRPLLIKRQQLKIQQATAILRQMRAKSDHHQISKEHREEVERLHRSIEASRLQTEADVRLREALGEQLRQMKSNAEAAERRHAEEISTLNGKMQTMEAFKATVSDLLSKLGPPSLVPDTEERLRNVFFQFAVLQERVAANDRAIEGLQRRSDTAELENEKNQAMIAQLRLSNSDALETIEELNRSRAALEREAARGSEAARGFLADGTKARELLKETEERLAAAESEKRRLEATSAAAEAGLRDEMEAKARRVTELEALLQDAPEEEKAQVVALKARIAELERDQLRMEREFLDVGKQSDKRVLQIKALEAEAKADGARHRDEVTRLQRNLNAAVRQRVQLTKDLQAVRGSSEETAKRLASGAQLVKSLTERIAALEDKGVQNQRNASERVVRLQEEVSDLLRKQNELEEKHAEQKRQQAALENRLQNGQSIIGQLQGKVSELGGELEAARTALASTEAELSALEDRVKSADLAIDASRRQAQDREARAAELQQKIAILEARGGQNQELRQNLESKLRAAVSGAQQLHNNAQGLERQKRELVETVAARDAEVLSLKDQIRDAESGAQQRLLDGDTERAALEQQIRNGEARIRNLRSVLAAKDAETPASEYESQIARLKEELAGMEKRAARTGALDAEIRGLRATIEGKRAEMASQERDFQLQLKRKDAEAQARIESLKLQNEEEQNRIKATAASLRDSLEARIRGLESRKSELEGAIGAMTNNAEALRAREKEHSNAVSRIGAEIQRANGLLEASEARANALRLDLGVAKAEASRALNELSSLKRERGELREALAKLEGDNTAALRIAQLEEDIRAKEESVNAYMKGIQDMGGAMAASEARAVQKAAAEARLQQELQTHVSDIALLRDQNEEGLRRVREGHKAELQRLDQTCKELKDALARAQKNHEAEVEINRKQASAVNVLQENLQRAQALRDVLVSGRAKDRERYWKDIKRLGEQLTRTSKANDEARERLEEKLRTAVEERRVAEAESADASSKALEALVAKAARAQDVERVRALENTIRLERLRADTQELKVANADHAIKEFKAQISILEAENAILKSTEAATRGRAVCDRPERPQEPPPQVDADVQESEIAKARVLEAKRRELAGLINRASLDTLEKIIRSPTAMLSFLDIKEGPNARGDPGLNLPGVPTGPVRMQGASARYFRVREGLQSKPGQKIPEQAPPDPAVDDIVQRFEALRRLHPGMAVPPVDPANFDGITANELSGLPSVPDRPPTLARKTILDWQTEMLEILRSKGY